MTIATSRDIQARILVTKEADFFVHSILRSHADSGANFDQVILPSVAAYMLTSY